MDPGIHDLTFGDYLELDAWGSGSLRAMRRGPPARVLWEKAHRSPSTDATRLGSAVHCALLTPDLFAEVYAYKPEGMSFSTKEGKAWRDEQEGREIISSGDAVLVEDILAALRMKPEVARSLDDATGFEQSFVWRCPITGELCKGRPDWIEGKYVYDLKVSRHAGGRALAYRAFVEGWMHQLAHYRTGAQALGLDVRGGRLGVVEPKPPHFVYLLEVKVDALDLLELENIEALKELRRCRLAEDFPGTPELYDLIEPPPMALAEAGELVATDSEEAF